MNSKSQAELTEYADEADEVEVAVKDRLSVICKENVIYNDC